MVPDEPVAGRGWLNKLRRAVASLLEIYQNLEALREESRVLRTQLSELGQLVHFQAGQIHQLDRRIHDAVEAAVLRELAKRTERAPGRPDRRPEAGQA